MQLTKYSVKASCMSKINRKVRASLTLTRVIGHSRELNAGHAVDLFKYVSK